MKKAMLIIMIGLLVCLSLNGCGQSEATKYKVVYMPAYGEVMVFSKSPVNVIPKGMYKIIDDSEATQNDIYVGVNTTSIPEGTMLYLNEIGFRIAINDSRVSNKSIILYGTFDVEDVFIWAITRSKYQQEDKRDFKIIEV